MKYQLNDSQIFADVTDGIAILINVETGVYYGLNTFTTNVFENIINGADTEEILHKISKLKGYDETVKEKYLAFVQELTSKGFIIEEVDVSTEVRIDTDEYVHDELDFVLSEYKSAAELLLADPIHQVKEEIGWGPSREALK